MSYNKGFNDGIDAVWDILDKRDRKRYGKELVTLIRVSSNGVIEYTLPEDE